MLPTLKVIFGLCLAVAVGMSLALGFDWLVVRLGDRIAVGRPSLALPASYGENSASSEPIIQNLDINDLDLINPSAVLIGDFIAETDPERRLWQLRQRIESASIESLQELFIEALSYDLEDRLVFQIAGIALKKIAQQNAAASVELLFALSPAEKEKLAWAVASGWAVDDGRSAWDWISTAWIDPLGNFIDRDLQNRLHREALDALMLENQDYQLAASLASTVTEPDLKKSLADLIAFRVVSDNPSAALDRIDFASNDYLDTAIMDAIVDEWAQRDSFGAKNWTLENEPQVSTRGARIIAKNLFLSEAMEVLSSFHQNLTSIPKKDSVAAEATRLLARRDPAFSVDWLHSIQSPFIKREATYDALYEIGHDSFESTIQYVDLAYASLTPERESTLYAALESWSRVDAQIVANYLDSGQSGMPSIAVLALKESLGIQ